MINTYDFQVGHPEIFSQLAVREMLFFYYKCPQQEKKVNLYTHYNKIMFVIEGRKVIHHRGRSWELTTNKAFFVKKTAYNQERFYDVDWEVLCFYCPDNFLKQVFKEQRLHLPMQNLPVPSKEMLLEINLNDAARAFFYSIVPYFSQQPPPSENLLELKFKELLFNILSNPANAGFLAYVYSISDQYKPLLQEIMDANYTFNLSLAEYARIAQRSLAAFKREFIETYQTTPGKWLTQKRLEYAQLLLHTSKKNVNEIAYESGFENATHFSRVFKEKNGLPPMQYRKQHEVLANA